ncbi:MAG: hypothetical protein ABSD72_15035 [Terracidiphilus sp.]|jgi:hypothetical protein
MCPACIESAIFTMAGVASTGAVGTFLVRSIARITKRAETEQPEKETIRHEHELDRTTEDGFAS